MRLTTICRNINNSVLKEDFEFWISMRELYFKEGEEAVEKEIQANIDWLDWFEKDEETLVLKGDQYEVQDETLIIKEEKIKEKKVK